MSSLRWTAARMMLTTIVAAGGALTAAARAGSEPQAGYLAEWADLSTWERENPSTREVEVGLGLVLDGPSGAMRLAFFVVEPARGRSRAPDHIGFRLAAGARVDPRLLRTPTLQFAARVETRAGTPRTVEIDLSARMMVDNPAPGASITSAAGTAPASALNTLADATTLSAVLLGARVELRHDQIAAIRAFRDRVLAGKR